MLLNRKHTYYPLLDIPEAKIGQWEIRHDNREPGAEFALSSTRTQIFQGDRGKKVRFTFPTRWHRLLEDNGVWMTDYPIEQFQHDNLLKHMNSSVLVGGLGLGYAATFLCLRSKVNSVVVIEKQPEVVELVGPHLLKGKTERRKLSIITADLFDFLKQTTEEFNYGFYDIWTGDSEGTFFQTVCPLLELSRGKVHRVSNWNEGCMRGQLYHSLQGRVWVVQGKFGDERKVTASELAISNGDIWHDWTAPFFRWYQSLPPDFNEDSLNYAIQLYIRLYGTSEQWAELWRRMVDPHGYRMKRGL